MKVALSIAGSDSGGGAGIQADIKAIQANGVFATTVITAVTAQNTVAVTDAFELPVDIIAAQMDAVFDDFDIAATKTGMLSSEAIIEVVADRLVRWSARPLVVDPVMISKSGYKLLRDEAIAALKQRILPLATLVTPNAHEAALLAGIEVRTPADAIEAARRIMDLGPEAVLVKGGHLDTMGQAIDIFFDGEHFQTFSSPIIETRHTHGTGCTYAAVITASLARGCSLRSAIGRGKRYVNEAIRAGLPLGSGHGPTNHYFFFDDRIGFPVSLD
jgi:hydroxymethylpyrimidine/phosphomethylpyrimidine kinase